MITSSNNSKIKLVRSLQGRSKNRKAESAFVAEGIRLIEEAISVNWPIDYLLFDETTSERGQNLINNLREKGDFDIVEIPAALMAEISDTETPQGILAVLQREALPLPESPTFVIIADQIRDPGNIGTLLRTAEAAGADAVILSPGTVDAFSPKVVRAGMGAHFHLPVQHKSWDEIKEYIGDIPTFLAEAEGGMPLWDANFTQNCALLVGGEAFGASREGRAAATKIVTIPMQGRVESLNAAVAGAIVIAEVLRQRYQD